MPKRCGCPDDICCECGWFYPGMTREEIDAYVAAHPAEPIDPTVLASLDVSRASAAMRDVFHPSQEIADQFLAGITDEDIQTIETWCNVQDGQWYTGSAETGGEEKFARGWERYLRRGRLALETLDPES